MSEQPKQRRRQQTGLTAPHPNSPSGRNFDYLYFVGAPHPNSPAGRNYDYRSTLGMVHPNSPAGRADLERAVRAMRQVQRDYYRFGSDISSAELEARLKAREVTLRILSRIKDEVTTVALAPLAVHEPNLFLYWTVGPLVDDYREARRDRLTFREFLLEELKQVVDSVDELRDKGSEGTRPRRVRNWSRLRGLAWSAFTDVDVVRGVLNVFNAANLQARSKTLDERQAYLATRHAYIKRELQRCVDALRRPVSSAAKMPLVVPPSSNKSAQVTKADRTALDQVRLSSENRQRLNDHLGDASPLNPDAVRETDELLPPDTDRNSLTMKPWDVHIPKKWTDMHVPATADQSNVETKRPRAVNEVTQKSPNEQTNWIGLRYVYFDGTGVGGAAYTVKNFDSGSVVAHGTLNNLGYAICALPMGVDNVSYDFHNDPVVVEYLSKPVPNPEQSKVMKGWPERLENGIKDGGLWLWGSVEGDFNEDATVGQIAVNAVITMIPFVDQAGDIRDISANLKFLIWDKRYKDKWVWIALVLTLVGFIPILGSAAKGVLKAVARGLKTGEKVPLGLLIDILNKFYRGNAVTWLRKLAADLPTRAVEMKRLFHEILDNLQGKLRVLADKLPESLRRKAEDTVSSIDAVGKVADENIDEAVKELQGGLEKSLDDGVNYERKGTTKDINAREQFATDPPDAPVPAPTKVKRTRGGRSGERTEVKGNDEQVRGLTRENESADALANDGFTVLQNPPKKPSGKEPDYLIEGEYFDCFAPSKTKPVKGIWDVVNHKVGSKQVDRIVLNLSDWGGDLEDLRAYFKKDLVKDLQEVLVVKEISPGIYQVFPL